MDIYIYIYSGVPKDKRAKGGVSISVKKEHKHKIKNWEAVDERLIQLGMDIHGYDVTVIGAYAPTTNEKRKSLTNFMIT